MTRALQQPLSPRAAYTDEPIFRLTVEQYHELIRSGKLTEDDPVELVEGILVFKMPKNTAHVTAIRLLRREMDRLSGEEWFFDSEQPITLADSEPEPDGIVVLGRIEDFASTHPGPENVPFVIEVADMSLERDRGIKLRAYARAGIADYWIINLIDRRVEKFSDPSDSGQEPKYGRQEILGAEEEIAVVVAGRVFGKIAVGSLLPPNG